MKNKVIILDTVHEILPKILSDAGFLVDIKTNISREELIKIINFYSCVILRSRIILDKEIIEHATNLKIIGRLGSGMESIDTEFAISKGIKCINSPEGNKDAVAEHAMGMLLALNNKLIKANQEVKQGKWIREENRGIEIKNKTVGIIGYGNMGSAFAKRLKGFDCKVIAYDKYKTNFSDEYATECRLNEIFEKADILSLHIPLTSETKYMVNEEFFNKFSKNIVFINTARGPIVKTEDLVKALKAGKVTGAALDVIEYEETSFEKTSDLLQYEAFKYLANSANVILSPHIAGSTIESKYKLAEVLANKIIEQFANNK